MLDPPSLISVPDALIISALSDSIEEADEAIGELLMRAEAHRLSVCQWSIILAIVAEIEAHKRETLKVLARERDRARPYL
jgi:hypothetical protein